MPAADDLILNIDITGAFPADSEAASESMLLLRNLALLYPHNYSGRGFSKRIFMGHLSPFKTVKAIFSNIKFIWYSFKALFQHFL
jgi:hypothetical protein